MYSSAQKNKGIVALSSSQLTYLTAEKRKLEGILAQNLGLIDVKESDLDNELANMIRNREMS
jgi:hypothetical protein